MVFNNIAKVSYTFPGSLQHKILVSKFFDRPAKMNKIFFLEIKLLFKYVKN